MNALLEKCQSIQANIVKSDKNTYKPYVCPACTFSNPANTPACEICMNPAPESAIVKSEAPTPVEKKITPIAEVDEDNMAATIVAKKAAGTYLTILEQLYENRNKDLIEEAE